MSGTIVSEHILWGCLMSVICGFDRIKSKHDVNSWTLYGKVLWILKTACSGNNFEKKKMVPLINKEFESYASQGNYYIYKKVKTYIDKKEYWKVRDRCHYTGKYRETIVIIQVNIEVLHTVYIIQSILYIHVFFTMDQTMTIILS